METVTSGFANFQVCSRSARLQWSNFQDAHRKIPEGGHIGQIYWLRREGTYFLHGYRHLTNRKESRKELSKSNQFLPIPVQCVNALVLTVAEVGGEISPSQCWG